jgi:hyperosmotically inducible periplasmic protein
MTSPLRLIAIVIAVAVALPVLISACAPTRTSDSTGQYIDDAAITAKVKTAILQDPALKVMEIKVDTHRNTVQLSGFVDDTQMIARAGDLARHVDGVTGVQNDLILK